MKVEVVITRLQKDAVVSRLPFTLWANANASRPATASLGIQVPIRRQIGPGETPAVLGPVNYQNVGTSISYQVFTLTDGWYKLEMNISDTSVAEGNDAAAVPIIKSLRLGNVLYLKDGQTVELASTTDKTSGEVAKVDVTVTRMR